MLTPKQEALKKALEHLEVYSSGLVKHGLSPEHRAWGKECELIHEFASKCFNESLEQFTYTNQDLSGYEELKEKPKKAPANFCLFFEKLDEFKEKK